MRFNSILRVIALTLVVFAFALVLSTCGKSRLNSGIPAGKPADTQKLWVAPPIQAADEVSLDEALAELSALETPDGVEPELFQQLKDELAKQLTAKGVSKIVSTPPTGEANRVDDLELIEDGGAYTLTWHYKNLGDYDQNGAVGISDITPIAIHYNEPYDTEDVNCLLAVIDGSGNGVVDIADITPIAMYYSTDCAGYLTEGDDTVEGAFTQVDTVGFGEATGTGRKQFAYELGVPEYEYYRVVPKDGLGESGAPSFIVGVLGGEKPTVTSVSPTTGVTESQRTFTAQVSGDSPFTYEWDFGGGGTPNTSAEESPTVTLADPGDYNASLTVSNAFGEDNHLFTLTVSEATVPGRGDWWMFGREPTHNRRSPFIGAQSATLKWRYETAGSVSSSPAIGADGTIYVGSWDEYLYAINPDGTLRWRYDTESLWCSSSPAIGTDGTIYVGSAGWKGHLHAVHPDGTLNWRYETGDDVSSPAIGADGTIYVGCHDGYLYAFKPDGTLKWRYETGDEVWSSPAIGADGTIYVGSDDGYLYAITDNDTEGTLKWRYETGSWMSSPAICADGTVYVGSDGYLYAIADGGTEGTLKWRYDTTYSVESSPAIGADGTVYVGSGDPHSQSYLYAIRDDETEGTLKWRYEMGWYVSSSPAIGADGTIYVGCWDDHLYAINSDGTLKWRYETGDDVDSSPAIGADGTVYVGSDDGYLYAFHHECAPTINSVILSPASGQSGWDVTFTAEVWGTAPLSYSWDFGGGATPNTSTEASPTATLGAPGDYDASLTVTNAYGSDTFDFTLTVEEQMPFIIWVEDEASARYSYDGGEVTRVEVYLPFDVSLCSGNIEITAEIHGEEKTETFFVEDGERYTVCAEIHVTHVSQYHEYWLTFSSPSAVYSLQCLIHGQGGGGNFQFESLGEITLE